ncbi:PTS sugar transporter subunit IIC [Enterococcus saccharolyticus]|uniref:PTS sugar transporter subunit IIC n=1 Tax=Enterococcus saccharolyticus TaxID=41997 RepID=UPI001E401C79|nr:PTS transporter subunit EIIC [Enterococcus saccharolyticus]MCD5002053.1 PTS sugar transporter subunit IIC [Enterococcus saccharolyticus]
MNAIDKLSEKLLPVAAKINNQRHLSSIRDGFIVTMPLIMSASLFILLNAVIFSNEFVAKFIDLSYFSGLAGIVNNGTMGILAILVCYNIGYNLANWYIKSGTITNKGFSPVHAGGVSVAAMFIMMPLTNMVTLVDGTVGEAGGIYLQGFTSSSGLFLAMLASLVGTELFAKLSKMDKLRISMPENVPPAVATSFNALVPEVLVIVFFAIFVFVLDKATGLTVPDVVNTIIQTPLKGFVLSAPGMLFLQFISDLLWVLGMHGSSILSPIKSAPMLEAIQENMTAFELGKDIPNIITEPFIGSFGLLGGGGCILPLIVAIIIVSKRKEQKNVARLGLLPSCFNISEPIMFGLPVVMNPIFMIPCALIPAINLVIAYTATSLGLIGRTVAAAPWITPPVFQAWISTGGNLPAAILAFLLFILDILLFIPFILASNKANRLENV